MNWSENSLLTIIVQQVTSLFKYSFDESILTFKSERNTSKRNKAAYNSPCARLLIIFLQIK